MIGKSSFELFDAIGALVVVLDVDGHIVHWNPPCTQLTGYSLEDVRGAPIWEVLVAPEDAAALKDAVAKVRDAKAQVQADAFANYWITKSGERRWIVWSNKLSSHPDGRVQYVIATGADRSDEKRTQDALRASEAKLAGMLQIAADAIISVDRAQQVVMYNRAAEEIFGWAADEVIGKPLEMLLPVRFRDAHARHVHAFDGSDARSRLMGTRRGQKISGLRKNGEEFPAEASISKLALDPGLEPLFTVVLRDVTEQRRHAEQLLEVNERMVVATLRAQELAEEADAARARVEKSEYELREVAGFRERFIGVVSHDLRNPLGAIQMAAELIARRAQLDEQDATSLARIVKGTGRMVRMISQLLDLTRARLGGGFPLELVQTDLRDVCRTVADEFLDRVHVVIADDVDVSGAWDPDRLEEALSNIVGNAIDYAAPDSPVVVTGRADDTHVVVEVANHGAPIPADVLPFIFEPFRRGDPQEMTIGRSMGNLGLGLYIASQIVLAHDGTLAAQSAEGTTTFVIRLPRVRAADRRTGTGRRPDATNARP